MTAETIYADDNTYTLNSLRKVLECNRLTAEKYIVKGNYKRTVKQYNNTEYEAWIIPENEIDRLRSNLHYTQQGNNVTSKPQQIKDVKVNDDVTVMQPNTTLEMLRNIKELNGRITTLENDNRQLQQEVKTLTNNNVVLEREKMNAESKVLLIEDKSRTFEGEVAKLGQELKEKDKQVTNLREEHTQELNTIKAEHTKKLKEKDKQVTVLNRIVIGLSAIILVAVTVGVTIYFVRF